MVTEGAGVQSAKEFGAWVLRQKGPLKLTTAIVSIAKIVGRWGFKEFVKDKK